MNTKNILSNRYLTSGLLLAAGLLLGWIFFHHSAPEKTETTTELHDHADDTAHDIWTCSMHPQIRMDEPGQCPLCGMDLIILKNSNAEIDDNAIEMSESALKLAEVQTSMVMKGNAFKEVQLYGKIQPNERLLQSQTAHVPGRIEQLLVNVTGESVKKGQLIAKVYSPELITAQKELLEAASLGNKYPAMLDAAREKLRNWKMTDQQITEIEKQGKVTSSFDIFANTTGIVTALKVNEGDYISKGAVLFEVADFSKVWAVFDAYESDLPWIKIGQKVEFTTQAIPGKIFDGKVSFIDPVINPSTRIARVRMELNNASQLLKPEMFVNGIVHAQSQNKEQELIIPQSAVLWTGTRSVVYVKVPETEEPTFKMREITLGPALANSYTVMEGLTEGEEIVVNGVFSVDAAAQLAGKTSMMNPASDASEPLTQSESLPSHVELSNTMFKVAGECEMCKDRIEATAKKVKGVKGAEWSGEKQMLNLTFDPKQTNSDAVQKAIAAVGHDTEKIKAPDSVYEKLPECCLYERLKY